MSALKDYLSKKYLDPVGSDKAAKKPKKKKKKNEHSTEHSGAVFKDDDEGDTLLRANKPSKRLSSKNMTFEEYTKRRKLEYVDDEEDEAEIAKEEETENAKLKKKNAWKRLDGSTKEDEPDETQHSADTSALSLHNKYYGLQTADQIAEQMREKAEAEAAVRAELAATTDIDAHNTVHRDAQGRRVDDIESIRQAEIDAEAAKKRAQERAHRRINAGVVQLRLEQEGAQSSDGTRYTRYADDAELNAQQRNKVDTFHDPAAAFLKKKKTTSIVKSAHTQSRHAEGLSWKIYPGPYPPNRFDISPGSMWDGVDRSTGFEKLWFQKESEIKERKNREYTSSYDI